MNIREKLYHIVFGTDTKAGKRFDIFLLWLIVFSVFAVMFESVPSIGKRFRNEFFTIEWMVTILFTLEYFLRIWISPKPIRYIFSFWGLIDFFSFVPTYLSFFIFGYHYLIVVRVFRLLRVFRILKLARFNSEINVLMDGLRRSMYKVSIFLFTVLAVVIFLGTIMYVVEGGEEGFLSIPQSIYWAVVTVTTVGYGDIVPHSPLGKFISSIAMIIGYGIIAVPTGIITVELLKSALQTKTCYICKHNNEMNAHYCNQCGNSLEQI